MENQEKNFPGYELVSRYLAGEAGPEEAMYMDDWRKQSPENEKLFDDIKKLWLAAGNPAPAYEKPDMESEWNRMRQRAVAEKPAARLLSMRVAAAILLLISFGAFAFWYFTAFNVQESTFVEVAVDSTAVRDVKLPDNSTVVLNKGAYLGYPEEFAKFSRFVHFEGEALFRVTRNASQPFMIEINEVTIQVIGTAFNVDATDSSVEVSVIEGAVMMMTSTDSIAIRKDQGGYYDKKTRQLRLLNTIDINKLGYATHFFRFNNLPMSEIKKILEKAYPVSLDFSNPSIGNCRIKTEFDNESIDHILEVLAKTIGAELKREGQSVNFIGNGCD